MTKSSNHEITQLLAEWGEGDKSAFDKLTELVYEELRRLAHRFIKNERAGHTLQTTALVHEAYMKLAAYEGIEEIEWSKRAQFFKLAAKVMRQILVDHARGANREKRGGGMQKASLDEAAVMTAERACEIIELDDALKSLERIDTRKSQIVELRYFGGLSIEEAAEALGIGTATVSREWRMASAWLRREMSRGDDEEHKSNDEEKKEDEESEDECGEQE